MRFVETEFSFLDEEFGTNSYDIFALPGPSYALANPADEGVEVPPFQLPFATAWQRGLSVSQQVNSTTQIVLVDHENCGYYNFYSHSGPAYLGADYATKKHIQFTQMSITLNYMRDTLTPQYPTVYYGYWIGLNGIAEFVPS